MPFHLQHPLDREWRYSAHARAICSSRCSICSSTSLRRSPGLKSFHMDSQTLPIQDYLEACPEKKPWLKVCRGGQARDRSLVLSAGRIHRRRRVADPQSIAGTQNCRRFGPVSKTGYSPFRGSISQMPQIYQGFGIDVASFTGASIRSSRPGPNGFGKEQTARRSLLHGSPRATL